MLIKKDTSDTDINLHNEFWLTCQHFTIKTKKKANIKKKRFQSIGHNLTTFGLKLAFNVMKIQKIYMWILKYI